jgi:hypothetical protein
LSPSRRGTSFSPWNCTTSARRAFVRQTGSPWKGTHLFVGRTRGAHLISLSQWLNLFGQIADDLELKFIAHAILLPFGDDLHHTFDVNKKANAQRPKNVLWNLDFKRRNTLMRRE